MELFSILAAQLLEIRMAAVKKKKNESQYVAPMSQDSVSVCELEPIFLKDGILSENLTWVQSLERKISCSADNEWVADSAQP